MKILQKITSKKIVLVFMALALSIVMIAACSPKPAPAPALTPAPATKPAPASTPAPTPAPKPTPAPTPAPTAAPKTEQIVIKFAQFTPDKDNLQVVMGWDFVKKVEERSKGALKFEYLGADEVFEKTEQMEKLRAGAIDMNFNTPSSGAGILYEGNAIANFRGSNQQMRGSGFYDLVRELYEKQNMYFLMRLDPSGWEGFYQIYLARSIVKPEDLNGRKIRATATYRPMLLTFGAVPVAVNPGELYTAFERGVVDGFCFPAASVFEYQLQEVAKFFVTPGFGVVQASLFFNLDTWKSIPQELQKLILDTTLELEKEWSPKLIEVHEGLYSRLIQGGVSQIILSPEDGERLNSVYYNSLWDDIIKRSPEYGPRLKELAMKK